MNIFPQLSVLDLTTVLAGPSVGTFFAELGARVIKIENPRTGGDVTRSWRHSKESRQTEYSAYYAAANYGKEILFLNLSDQSDRATLDKLIYTSDVVLSNFKSGDEEKFGLTSEDIHRINPFCIHGKIIGFESHPSRVAYDVVLQAETGYMQMNGTDCATKIPVAITDILAAHQLKEGILCALVKKGHSKKGFVVQCSLEKSGISALVNQASSFLMHGIEEKQQGSLHPGIAPYGETFECAQGTQIVLAIGSDQQFNAFCECMNLQALKTDIKFSNNPARVENRIELKKLIDGHLKGKTAAEWVAKFTLHHIPSGEIKTMAQVFQTDAAHGMILERQIEGQTLKSVRNVAFQIT